MKELEPPPDMFALAEEVVQDLTAIGYFPQDPTGQNTAVVDLTSSFILMRGMREQDRRDSVGLFLATLKERPGDAAKNAQVIEHIETALMRGLGLPFHQPPIK